jgi:hypothetical protein
MPYDASDRETDDNIALSSRKAIASNRQSTKLVRQACLHCDWPSSDIGLDGDADTVFQGWISGTGWLRAVERSGGARP